MLLGNWHRGQFIVFVSLFLATVGIGFAYYHEWQYALIVLSLATLADTFTANFMLAFQLNEAEWAFSKELHQLAKFVVFGLLPGLFSFFITGTTSLSLLILVVYVCAVGGRLSYYNMASMYRQDLPNSKTYGLQVEYMGLILPFVALVAKWLPQHIFSIVLLVVMLLFSIAYIIRYAFPQKGTNQVILTVVMPLVSVLMWLVLGNIPY